MRPRIGSEYGDATGSQLGSTRSAETALTVGKRSLLPRAVDMYGAEGRIGKDLIEVDLRSGCR
jgi:hypothetical protein